MYTTGFTASDYSGVTIHETRVITAPDDGPKLAKKDAHIP